MIKHLKKFLAGFAMAAMAASATASVTYNGGEFGVEVTGGSGTTWNFQYTADFTGFTTSATQAYIAGINFKVSGFDITSLDLISTTAPGTWSEDLANLNASGCSGGATDFACSQVSPLTAAATSGTYEWNFTVTFDSAITDPITAFGNTSNPIRAWFVNADGKNAGLMSLAGSFDYECVPGRDPGCSGDVPEPAALALLGIGGLAAALATRRRRKQQ